MSNYTNTLYFSGVTTGVVIKAFGLEYNTINSDLTTHDSNFISHENFYVNIELFLTEYPGAVYSNNMPVQEPRLDTNGNPIRFGETQFLVVSESDYENNKWSQWTTFLNPARLYDGNGDLIKYDIDYITEDKLTGTTFTPKVIKQIFDIDYMVYSLFDSYNQCLSAFVNILEIVKTKINNSFDDYSYDYDIFIRTSVDDGIYTGYTNHVQYLGNPVLPLVMSKEYYDNRGGLLKETGCHYNCLITHYQFGGYTGFGVEHTPWSIINSLYYVDVDPQFELSEYWANVIVHELGHCFGLDHSFRNIQGGWNKIEPTLPIDALDNLSRGEVINNCNVAFNGGQFFLSYSGEAQGKSAIMSYFIDPSTAYGAPLNVTKLIDIDYDVFSGSSLYRNHPIDTQEMGCLFLNNGPRDFSYPNWDATYETWVYNCGVGNNNYTGLNINLLTYMNNSEFVENEITGLTINFTAKTGIEKYMQPSLYYAYIDSSDITWTDTMSYYILAYNNTNENSVLLYSKITESPYPKDITTGNTDNITLRISSTTFSDIESSVLDYSDLENFGIKIIYLSGEYGNVLLEIDDLQLDIKTTGGTYTRKARNYNNLYSGSTKVSHPGIYIPPHDRFTSYEVLGCLPGLQMNDYLFSLPKTTLDVFYYVSIFTADGTVDGKTYINVFNLDDHSVNSIVLSDDPTSTLYYSKILDFEVDDNYLHLLSTDDVFDVETNTTYTANIYEKYIVSDHLNFSIGSEPIIRTHFVIEGNPSNQVFNKIKLSDDNSIYLGSENLDVFYTGNTYGSSILTKTTLNSNDIYLGSNTNTKDILDCLSGNSKMSFILETSGSFSTLKQVHRDSGNATSLNFSFKGTTLGDYGTIVIKKIVFDSNDENYDIALMLENGNYLKITGNTYNLGEIIVPLGVDLITNIFSGQTGGEFKFAKYKNYKDVKLDFYGSQVYYLSGLGTNYIYNFASVEPIGITPVTGDTISGFTYAENFDYNGNILQNAETFYKVVTQDDYNSDTSFSKYRSITLPIYKKNGDTIDYNFEIISPSETQPPIVFDGTIRIKLILYLSNYYGEGINVDQQISQIESHLNFFSTQIEEIPYTYSYGFNFDVTWEIFNTDVQCPYDSGSLTDFRNYFEDVLNLGSPKDYNGSPHILVNITPNISFGTANGLAFINGAYFSIKVSEVELGIVGGINNVTFIHELGHCLGLSHSFENYWNSVFPDLLIKTLDTGNPTYLPSDGGVPCCDTGNQIKHMPYYNELPDDEGKKLSVMSYSSFNYDYYNSPSNPQKLLLENKIITIVPYMSMGGGNLENIGDNINVTYVGFLDNLEISDPSLDYIEVFWRSSNSGNAHVDTVRLINSGSTNNYMLQSDSSSNSYRSAIVSGTSLFDVYDHSNQLGFGLEIKRERVSDTGSFSSWNMSNGDIKIKFYLSDGSTLEKLPTDLYTITDTDERIQSYASSTQRTTAFNSYEMNIIRRNLNYYLYNYYKD